MKDFPSIKIALLFVTGIISAKFFAIPFLIFVSLIIVSLVIYLWIQKKHPKYSGTSALIIIVVTVLSFGNIYTLLNKKGYNFLPDNYYKVSNVSVEGEISSIDLIKNDEVGFEIRSSKIVIDSTTFKIPFNFKCRFKDTRHKLGKFYENISVGNVVSIRGNYTRGKDKRNPGEFDYSQYLRSIGIAGVINVYDADKIKVLNHRVNIFSNIVFSIRKAINSKIERLYDKNSAPLIRGLILADKSEISYDTKTEFINSGVIHILAVSGLHVGYIIIIFLFLFGRLNIYLRSILTTAGLIIFLILINSPPSAFRATIMAVVLIIAYLSNRSSNLLNSVSLAAIILLLLDPGQLFNAGFQLSFSAVISIAVIYPLISNLIQTKNYKNKYIKNVLLFIGVSLAAQIGTLPFTIYYFGKLSLIALFTNMIVIPVVGVIVGIAILSVGLSVISISLASYFSLVNGLVVKFILWLIHITGSYEFAFLQVRNFTVTDLLLFYLFLVIAIYFNKKFSNKNAKTLLFLFCLVNFFMYASLDNIELLPSGKLCVMMVDVGQGDAFLVKFPDGKTALIDAGEATYYFDNGERVVLPLLDYLGIDKIDYGFVTHLDLDHYGGFVSLIHNAKIFSLYKPALDTTLQKDIRFENYVDKNHIDKRYYSKKILKVGNTRIYILNIPGVNKMDTNNRSGVLKVVYGNSEVLFTGDIEKPAEKFYANHYKEFLNSDILKVAHHGSKTSSSDEFLNFVTPQISLISAGIQNKFNHPSEITLQKLNEIHSKVFRTDRSGAILLQTNGNSISEVNWRE